MCGIVGYIGKQQAAPILLDGLSKLEYRGYDVTFVQNFTDIDMIRQESRYLTAEKSRLPRRGAGFPCCGS